MCQSVAIQTQGEITMKLIIKKDAGEPYGVELIASSSQDREIVRRFWEGGVKLNSVTNGDEKIEFTFADLIGK